VIVGFVGFESDKKRKQIKENAVAQMLNQIG